MNPLAYRNGTTPLLIGVCGGSGSGKTVLSNELAAALGPDQACCLSLDSYYRPEADIPPELVNNYDHPGVVDEELLSEHLMQLRAGQTIQVLDYDFATHTRVGEGTFLEPRPAIILEGVLLFAFDEIRSQLGLSVFLDVPADLRLARRLNRDVRERGRTMECVLEQYFASVRPMYTQFVEPGRALANLVIDHEKTIAEAAQEILIVLQALQPAESEAKAEAEEPLLRG